MTSCGPNSQSYNFTHMFEFNDVNGKYPTKCYKRNSIMYVLDNHPDFRKFTYIVKLADLDMILDSIQANFTIFVPSDTELNRKKNVENILLTMDEGTAKNIVYASLINNRLPKEIIKNSPVYYLNTLSPQNRMFISTIDENTKINNKVNIIHFDIICNNGVIHVTDNMLDLIFL